MLGFFTLNRRAGQGDADRILAALAECLAPQMRLAGAVQANRGPGNDCQCDMDLLLLGQPEVVRISQNLGPGATACRLDAEGLERAAAAVEAQIARGADLVILSKFGKQESLGRGFCSTIAAALERDLPVLLSVPQEYRDAFLTFAGDLAQEVAPDALAEWCRKAILQRQATT